MISLEIKCFHGSESKKEDFLLLALAFSYSRSLGIVVD
jgi:hypothetical protein